MWGVDKNRKVWTSSLASGVLDWDKTREEYVHRINFVPQVLGDLVSVDMRLDSELRDILTEIGVLEEETP